MKREIRIERVTDPEQGPLDGVKLHTSCAVTRFAPADNPEERKIAEQSLQDCAVLASYGTGTLSISVRGDVDMMFSIRLDELFALVKMAADAAIDLEKSKEEKK